MVFTQKMSMHLNGGSKFSELRYNIYADDKLTNLKRTTRTSGSPKYVKTVDVIFNKDNVELCFDILAAGGVGLNDWIIAHVKVEDK